MIRVTEKQARDFLRTGVPGPTTDAKPTKSRKSPRKQPEATAQKEFVKWARVAIKRPAHFWFVPNGLGKLGHFMASWGKDMGLTAGVSDIHVMWPGGMGFIEFKSKTGPLRPEQEAFLADAKACGHHQGVARSQEDAERLLRAWGCPLSPRVTHIAESERAA